MKEDPGFHERFSSELVAPQSALFNKVKSTLVQRITEKDEEKEEETPVQENDFF